MKKVKINIAEEYTTSPGGRKKTDGLFSGEDFREKYLEQYFEDSADDTKIEINLDGTMGYPTSFTEEAFGGLARKYGIKRCKEKLEFISEEEPKLVNEIILYIDNCSE